MIAVEKVYEICYYGGLILAILLVIAAIILFIVLKIPRVFGELTGRSAKKGIQNIKNGSGTELNVAKKEQEKYYNQGTGKIKVRETVSEKTRKANRDDTTDLLRTDADNNNDDETEVLGAGKYAEKDSDATEVLGSEVPVDDDATDVLASDRDDDATDVLTSDRDDDATDVLTSDRDDDATDVLTSNRDDDATDVLTSDIDNDATDVLRTIDDDDQTTVLAGGMTDELSRKVKVMYNVVITHTNEKL